MGKDNGFWKRSKSHFYLLSSFFSEKGSHEAQGENDLELLFLLSVLPECYNYKCCSLQLTFVVLEWNSGPPACQASTEIQPKPIISIYKMIFLEGKDFIQMGLKGQGDRSKIERKRVKKWKSRRRKKKGDWKERRWGEVGRRHITTICIQEIHIEQKLLQADEVQPPILHWGCGSIPTEVM